MIKFKQPPDPVDRISPEKIAKGLKKMFTERQIREIKEELENDQD